jgi:hypothetical protein
MQQCGGYRLPSCFSARLQGFHLLYTQSPLLRLTLQRTLPSMRMTTGQNWSRRWSSWTIEVKVWKVLAVLVILPILVMWFKVVHQNDEILALSRSEVLTDASGRRTWEGTFVNTHERPLRDVAVTVDFLDSQDRTVGKAEAEAAELAFSAHLDLQAPLPPEAVSLRIYSVQWRMGDTAALMGPFRKPWEFGYLMVDPTRWSQ